MSMSAAQIQVDVSTNGAPQVANELGRLGSTVQNMGGMFQQAIATALGFALVQPIINGIGEAFNFVTDTVIGFNASLEQSQLSMSVMMKSTSAATDMLQQLLMFSVHTPFNFATLQQGARQLLAFGTDAKDVIPILTTLGDTASIVGGGNSKLMSLIHFFGQLQTRGVATLGIIDRMTMLGVPAWQIMADQLGTTPQKLMKDATSGHQLDSSVAIPALLKGLSERFGGEMSKQALTFNGALTTLNDALQVNISKMFKPIFEHLRDGIVGLSQFFGNEQFIAKAEKFSERFAVVINRFFDVGGKIAGGGMAIMKSVGGLFNVAASIVMGLPNGTQNPLGTVDWFKVADNVVSAFAIMAKPLNDFAAFLRTDPVGEGFASMVTQLAKLGKQVDEDWDPVVKELGRFFRDDLGPALLRLGTPIATFGKGIGDVAKSLLELGATLDKWKAGSALPLVKVLEDLSTKALDLAGNLAQLTGKFLSVKVAPDIGNLAGGLDDFWKKLKERMPQIGNLFSGLTDFLKGIWLNDERVIAGVFGSVWTVASGVVQTVLAILGGVFLFWADVIGGHWDKLAADMQSQAIAMTKGIGKIFQGLGEFLLTVVAGIIGSLHLLWPQIFPSFDDVQKWGQQLIQSIIDGIEKMIPALKSAVGQAAAALNPLNAFNPAALLPGGGGSGQSKTTTNVFNTTVNGDSTIDESQLARVLGRQAFLRA
jgi:hypothetical protein